MHRAFNFATIQEAALQIAQLMRAKGVEGAQLAFDAGEHHALCAYLDIGEAVGAHLAGRAGGLKVGEGFVLVINNSPQSSPRAQRHS